MSTYLCRDKWGTYVSSGEPVWMEGNQLFSLHAGALPLADGSEIPLNSRVEVELKQVGKIERMTPPPSDGTAA